MTNVEAFDALLAELSGVDAVTVSLGRALAADIDAGVGTARGVNAALVGRYVDLVRGMADAQEEGQTEGVVLLSKIRDAKAG